jgi:spore coat polysaccharide biosynthesis protein SpsF (cytidylyltransferase family)
LIDDMVDCLLETGVDYVASTHMQHARNWGEKRTFPTGISVQVVRAPLVHAMAGEVTDPAIRELGLYAIYDDERGRFRRHAFSATGKYKGWCHPELRMTVDTPEDFHIAERIYDALYAEAPDFSTARAIKMLVDDPELRKLNGSVMQRVGYETLDESRNPG